MTSDKRKPGQAGNDKAMTGGEIDRLIDDLETGARLASHQILTALRQLRGENERRRKYRRAFRQIISLADKVVDAIDDGHDVDIEAWADQLAAKEAGDAGQKKATP